MRFFFIFLIILFFSCIHVIEYDLSGTVYDSVSLLPISNVNVEDFLYETSDITDESGKFQLIYQYDRFVFGSAGPHNTEYQLNFKKIGYKEYIYTTQETDYNDINIFLIKE